jgi:glycosyltransferase involved in cell wall biosynthesis
MNPPITSVTSLARPPAHGLLPGAAGSRVAFFLVDFSGGGIERVNINIANELASRGFKVDIVVAQYRGEFANRIALNVRVVPLGCDRAYQCIVPLARYLRVHRPAVLFTCFPTFNLAAIAANLLAGNPTRIVPVEHMPVSVDRAENPSVLPRLCYALYPLFYRTVPVIIANCEESAADFRVQYPALAEKVRVLYNPVVPPDLEQSARKELPNEAFFHAQDKPPVLIGAGRLTRQKDFPLLLRAFALVRQSRACKLILLGGRGEDRDMLIALTRELGLTEHVRFTGFVDNPYAYFQRADLFVLSSRYETLPTVLIEALACGTPAVATNCFGVGEILEHGKLGEIISGADPATLAQAILRSLKNPIRADALRAKAQQFSISTCASAYAKLINTLSS